MVEKHQRKEDVNEEHNSINISKKLQSGTLEY